MATKQPAVKTPAPKSKSTPVKKSPAKKPSKDDRKTFTIDAGDLSADEAIKLVNKVKTSLKKKAEKVKDADPIVTVGSHSVHTQYPDGRVEFVVDDEKLRADVMEALAMFSTVEKKPAVKAKAVRTKKSKE